MRILYQCLKKLWAFLCPTAITGRVLRIMRLPIADEADEGVNDGIVVIPPGASSSSSSSEGSPADWDRNVLAPRGAWGWLGVSPRFLFMGRGQRPRTLCSPNRDQNSSNRTNYGALDQRHREENPVQRGVHQNIHEESSTDSEEDRESGRLAENGGGSGASEFGHGASNGHTDTSRHGARRHSSNADDLRGPHSNDRDSGAKASGASNSHSRAIPRRRAIERTPVSDLDGGAEVSERDLVNTSSGCSFVVLSSSESSANTALGGAVNVASSVTSTSSSDHCDGGDETRSLLRK